MATLESSVPDRGSWSVRPKRAHLISGSGMTIATVLLPIAFAQTYWNFQAILVSQILKFTRVPHELFLPGSTHGLRFFPHVIPPVFTLDKAQLTGAVILIIIAVILLAILIIAGLPRLSPPLQIVAIFFLVLMLVNIAYQILHPEQPWPLQVDWLTSGIVIMPLIALVFTVTVFPIPGPLWIKFAALLGCLAYSFVWSTLRLSLALASLFHLGAFSYMFLEYLPGAFVDFVYILLFYSLVMHRMALHSRREHS